MPQFDRREFNRKGSYTREDIDAHEEWARTENLIERNWLMARQDGSVLLSEEDIEKIAVAVFNKLMGEFRSPVVNTTAGRMHLEIERQMTAIREKRAQTIGRPPTLEENKQINAEYERANALIEQANCEHEWYGVEGNSNRFCKHCGAVD